MRIDQRNMSVDFDERYRYALEDFNAQAVRQQAHDACRFDPGDGFELLLLVGERNVKDVAINVGAQRVEYLCPRDVAGAEDFDVVAGVDAEAPGLGSVAIDGDGDKPDGTDDQQNQQQKLDAAGGFSRQRAATYRYTFLAAQEWRFAFVVEVEQAGVERRFVVVARRRARFGNRVEVLIRYCGRAFPRHEVVKLPKSSAIGLTISVFIWLEQRRTGGN